MEREPQEPGPVADDQEDEVRAYERSIEDPPADLRIRNREGEDEGRFGSAGEPDRRDRSSGDNRPAEAAAIHIEDDEPDS